MPQEKIKVKNNELIYQEIKSSRDRQNNDISLLNQKINWIFAGNILLLIAMMQTRNISCLHLMTIIILILSLSVCLLSIFSKDYTMGRKLKNLYQDKDLETNIFIDKLNKRTIEALNKNKMIIKSLSSRLKLSIIFLIIGLIFIAVDLIARHFLYALYK